MSFPLEGNAQEAGAYSNEISHGEVVCQGRRNPLILVLELRTAGYHQFLRGTPNGKRLDCVTTMRTGKEYHGDHYLPVIGLVWPIRWTRWY